MLELWRFDHVTRIQDAPPAAPVHLPAVHPHWRLTRAERGPSLAPSIWLTVEPYCHFWLSSGRVHWVRRRGGPPGVGAGRHE